MVLASGRSRAIIEARPNVQVLGAKPTLDETMVAMDIRGADLFIAALRTPAENGLAALKAKMTYGVEHVHRGCDQSGVEHHLPALRHPDGESLHEGAFRLTGRA